MKKSNVILSVAAVLSAAFAGAATVSVDWAAETGPVKPVNGVGQPPIDRAGTDPLNLMTVNTVDMEIIMAWSCLWLKYVIKCVPLKVKTVSCQTFVKV